MSPAGWMLLVGAVLAIGMVVSMSTRLVVARVGSAHSPHSNSGVPVTAGPGTGRIPHAEGNVAQLLELDRRNVRVVRCENGDIHCSVVVPPQQLPIAVEQLSDAVDEVLSDGGRWSESRVIVTAETA